MDSVTFTLTHPHSAKGKENSQRRIEGERKDAGNKKHDSIAQEKGQTEKYFLCRNTPPHEGMTAL